MDLCSNVDTVRRPFLPALPPAVPKAAQLYPNSLLRAPYTALMGMEVDGREPVKVKATARNRVRKHVGSSNRWRLPEALGSDLLGRAQAIKSTSKSYPEPEVRLIRQWSKANMTLDKATDEGFNKLSCLLSESVKPYPFDRKPLSSPGRISQIHDPTHKEQIQTRKKLLRSARPLDLFHYHSKLSQTATGPDVLLRCLDINWELHRPYLQKARTLAEMLHSAKEPSPKQYYKGNLENSEFDSFVKRGGIYNNDIEQNVKSEPDVVNEPRVGIEHPKHSGRSKINTMTVLELELDDPKVSKRSMATALGHLYHNELEIPSSDVVGVLGAAYALRFTALVDSCCDMMSVNIRAPTVCAYHEAALCYNLFTLKKACEDWLQMNLVPKMTYHIQLGSISQDLLQILLQSNRLYTPSEYAVYKTVATWIFLHMNPEIQVLPSYSNIVAYFNSLPKISSLIEREETEYLAPLLKGLRFHGITDSNHIQELQQMNLLPQKWLVDILNDHFRSLQDGGDMHRPRKRGGFLSGAVRQGFILDNEPIYHSEIMELLGFHFELKAMKQESNGGHCFYMQRLKPSDPILSFRQNEIQMYCMRPDRDTTYNIRVQYYKDGHMVTESTGVLNQKFGLGDKSAKSKILQLFGIQKPVYVTFSLLFNPC